MIKDNSTLLRKLKQYSALSGALIATAGVADAQVVYTNVIPDEIINGDGDTYNLDLDNNGVPDYVFQTAVNGTYRYAGVYMYYATNIIAGIYYTNSSNGFKYGYPFALAAGIPIDDNLSFFDIYDILFTYQSQNVFIVPGMFSIFGGSSVGYWGGQVDQYLGLKFTDGTNNYFGWARCDVSDDATTITVKDYAYNATAETAIGAGEGLPTGIAGNNTMNFRVFGYEGVVNIIVNDRNLEDANVTVTNMLGQTVINSALSDVITRIDLNQYGKGIYMVTIQRGEESFSKKVSFR